MIPCCRRACHFRALRQLSWHASMAGTQDWVVQFEKPKGNPAALEPCTTVLSPAMKFGCLSARLFYARLAQVSLLVYLCSWTSNVLRVVLVIAWLALSGRMAAACHPACVAASTLLQVLSTPLAYLSVSNSSSMTALSDCADREGREAAHSGPNQLGGGSCCGATPLCLIDLTVCSEKRQMRR